MITVIWEDANNCIDSIVNTLTNKFPKDARFHLSKKPSPQELELLTRPPMVFLGWLIFANKRTPARILSQLDNCRSENIIVIRVDNQKDFKSVQAKVASLNAQFFDNHLLGKDKILKWVSSELNCSEDTAKFLYYRVGGYLKELVFAVQSLKKSEKTVTRALIRSLVDENNSVSMLSIAEYILGIKNEHVSKDDVFNTLYKFRYAEKWILETLLQEVQLYITVHSLVSDLTLNIQNYSTQADLLKDEGVRGMPKWKLKRMILNYGKVSLERMIFTKAQLATIGKSNFNLIKILQLASIGGL